MFTSNTRKFLLATCIAAVPAYALAQSPSQQNQNQRNLNPEPMTQTSPRGAQTQQQNQQMPRQQMSGQQMSGQQMSGKFLAAPPAGHVRAEHLREADIYTEDNQKVGDIDDILLDRQGRIVAVVVGVGGFLGIGENNVGSPFEALRMQEENVAASGVGAPSRTTGATNERTTERMTTGAVQDNRPVTDQDRQRATGQRAEQMGQERADRQAPGGRTESNMPAGQQRQTTTTTTTTTQPMRTAQAGGLWKPERIILRGVTKAELEAAPEFKWDAAAGGRPGAANPPPRNR